jgi:hypothetical protein
MDFKKWFFQTEQSRYEENFSKLPQWMQNLQEKPDDRRKRINEQRVRWVHSAIIVTAYGTISYALPYMLYRWIMGPLSTEGWHVILIGFVGTPILMWLDRTSPLQ